MTPWSNISANKKWANDTLWSLPDNYRRHLISFDNSQIVASILNVLFGNWCYLNFVKGRLLDLLCEGQLSWICILNCKETPGLSSLELSLLFGLFVNLTPLICTYFNLWLGLWPLRWYKVFTASLMGHIPAEIKIVLKCDNEVRSFEHVILGEQALIFFLLRINLLLNYFV